MITGDRDPIDSYQELSPGGLETAKEKCLTFCYEKWVNLETEEFYCCWFGKGAASSIDFELC